MQYESQLQDLTSIARAAKIVRMDKAALRDFVLSRGLAIQWSGKRFKVKLSEVEAALIKRRYSPPEHPAEERPRSAAPRGGRLHPRVQC